MNTLGITPEQSKNLKKIDDTKIESAIGMLDAMKPSFATYAEAGEAFVENWATALMLDEEHKAVFKMVANLALEKIARR